GTGQGRLDKYLDPSGFGRPPSYVFGNAPRTMPRTRGPGLKNVDMSIFKNVYFDRDRVRRLEIQGGVQHQQHAHVLGSQRDDGIERLRNHHRRSEERENSPGCAEVEFLTWRQLRSVFGNRLAERHSSLIVDLHS